MPHFRFLSHCSVFPQMEVTATSRYISNISGSAAQLGDALNTKQLSREAIMELEQESQLFPQGVDDTGQPFQPEEQSAQMVIEAVNPGPKIARGTIIARAETWLHPPVPYTWGAYKDHHYRMD